MGKAALLFVAASFIAAAFLMFGQQKTSLQTDERQSEYQEVLLARQSAEAGLSMAVSQARRDFDGWRDGFEQAGYEGGQFDVNLDGTAAGPIRITAVGAYGGAEHQAEVTLARLAPSPAALIVDADTVTVDFSGSNFLITGQDTRPRSGVRNRREGNGSGDYVNGVWTRTAIARSAFEGAAYGDRAARIRGTAAQANIVRENADKMDQFPVNLNQLHTEAQAQADDRFSGGQTFNNQTFGAPGSPRIVLVNGPAVFTGTTRGYGLLVVEGNLVMSDDFEWEGIVLARSEEEEMSVVMSQAASVYGALVTRQGYTPPAGGGTGSTECPARFDIIGNEVVLREPARVNLQVLGAAISYGGQYNMPVTAQVVINGQAYEPWGGYDKAVDGNLNTGQTYSFAPAQVFEAGTRFRVNARSWSRKSGKNGSQNAHWSIHMERNSQTTSNQLAVLRDGSPVPNMPGYLNQSSAKDFVADYIDTAAGVMRMEAGEAINLFELGTTNTSSAAHDMQDLVVLINSVAASSSSQSGSSGTSGCSGATAGSGGSGGGAATSTGILRFEMRDNAGVQYSSEAIGKLAARLPSVKQASWIIRFDQLGTDTASRDHTTLGGSH